MSIGNSEGIGGEAASNTAAINEATYDALWNALGDEWFEGRRKCIITETATGSALSLEQETNYKLKVTQGGARWSVELTHEGPDGFGGYDVQNVTSATGHTAAALNERLLAFHRAVVSSEASVLRRN